MQVVLRSPRPPPAPPPRARRAWPRVTRVTRVWCAASASVAPGKLSRDQCDVWCELTGQGSVCPVQILRPWGGGLQAEMLPRKTAETVQNMPEKLPDYKPLDRYRWNKLINYRILSPFTWQFWPGWWTASYRGTGHSEDQSTGSSHPLQRCCWQHHSHCSQLWASGNLDLKSTNHYLQIYLDLDI